MSNDEVITERSGGVLIAKLNRPAKRNAINGALADALNRAVREVDEDPALRVGIVTSSTPGMFCAGGDIAAMAAGELAEPDGSMKKAFYNVPHVKPWIAAMTGPVLGGGLEIALACEMRVAGENSVLGLPEARRGIVALGGGVIRLPRAIPRAIALEMVLTGERISAMRAYEVGLVNRVCPDEAVLDEALALARGVVACAPLSVRESLALVRKANEHTEEELWAMAEALRDKLRASNDAKEGMQAFLEKRDPVWTDT